MDVVLDGGTMTEGPANGFFFEGIDDSGCVMIPTTLLVQINGIIGVLQSNIMLTMRGDASLGQIHGS